MISASPEFILMKFRGTAVLQARRAISMDLSTSAGLMEGVYLETLDKGKEDVWALVAGEGMPRLLPERRPGSLCYSSFPQIVSCQTGHYGETQKAETTLGF